MTTSPPLSGSSRHARIRGPHRHHEKRSRSDADFKSNDDWKEGHIYALHHRHHGPGHPVSLGHRIQQMTWSWFTLTMSTGGLALLLDRTPHQFRGLSVIGRIVYILDLVLFVFVAAGLTYRFVRNSRAFSASLLHPTEAFFFPCSLVSISTILAAAGAFGAARAGEWLSEALYVLFWVYLAVAIVSAVVQYSALFNWAHIPVHSMTPTWLLPIFPVMLVGTLAASIAPLQDPTRAMTVCVAGTTAQGLGWTVACLIYPLYLARLMQDGLPAPGMRPIMFVAVGPPGFTSLAAIGIAKALPPEASYFVENPGARETLQAVAAWLSIWIWAVGFWFFSQALAAVLPVVYRGELEYTMGWWAFVFPNVGFTISTGNIGQQLGSEGVMWVASAMTICVVVAWLVVFGALVRAFVRRKVLWPRVGES